MIALESLARVFGRVAGLIWMSPTLFVGLLFFLLAKATGSIRYVGGYGPALAIRLQGRFAEWMGRDRVYGKGTSDETTRKWYGHTMGPFVFFYSEWTLQQIQHEARHVEQQMWLGPFHVPTYALSYLIGLIRYRDSYEAYRHVWHEQDARRAACEE